MSMKEPTKEQIKNWDKEVESQAKFELREHKAFKRKLKQLQDEGEDY